MLRFMGSQRVDTTEQLNWTELNWTELNTEEQLQLGGISTDSFDKKKTKANSYKMLYTIISLC